MSVDQSIQPLNVAAATLLIQLMFVGILGVTSSLYRSRSWGTGSSNDDRIGPSFTRWRSPTTLLALSSFALLLISDELYSIWAPLFQGVGINTMSATVAIFLVFVLNILVLAYLIAISGGSRSSPFTPALLTLPALAIFLRLPPSSFLTFACLAAIIYLGLLLIPFAERGYVSQKPAAFMTLACLFLSIFTGYITRPVPITELSAAQAAETPSNRPPM